MQKNHTAVGAKTDRAWQLEHQPFQCADSGQYDRRTGIERRHFTYTLHIPERRAGGDRRALH